MEKFVSVTAPAAAVNLKDIDTDLIIPAEFLTSTSRDGYGQNLFSRLRQGDENFFLNREDCRDVQILVTDSNFGCGSSREHAVWAIQGAGLKVVISKSFADIFFSNSAKNGLLLVTLPDDVVDRLLQDLAATPALMTVDLETEEVTLPDGGKVKFSYDPFRRHCLLNGHDDVDYILASQTEVDSYRQSREEVRYYSTLQGNH